MKLSKILILVIVASVIIITIFSLQESQSGDSYVTEVQQYREEKDKLMVSDGMPFEEARESFTGLNYFNPDIKYRISASLTSIKNKKSILLATNDGLENRYLEYAYADFAIDGTKCRLLILEVMESGPNRGTLFLAFADETSTRETYGAGRYLDVKKLPGSTAVLLDFNKAYNPYCAYSDRFSCPFPPKENILPVSIPAGEKAYKNQ